MGIIELIYIFIILYFIYLGWKQGAIVQLFTFVGLTVAYFSFISFGHYISARYNISSLIISSIIAFTIIYGVFFILGIIISSIFKIGGIFTEMPIKVLGASVGFIKGIIMCIIVTHLVLIPFFHTEKKSKMSEFFAKIDYKRYISLYERTYQKIINQKKINLKSDKTPETKDNI